jgi:hypothetical protein
MSDKPWKQFERHAASLFDGKRHWANSGERVDFESDWAIGQCKLVKTLSLEALTKLAEEMEAEGRKKCKVGIVCTKVRRGSGKTSPTLIVMTEESMKALVQNKIWHLVREHGLDNIKT